MKVDICAAKRLITRAASGAFIVGLFCLAIIYSPWSYITLLMVTWWLMLVEWRSMCDKDLGIAGYKWVLFVPLLSLILARLISRDFRLSLLYFVSIWAMDSFAMFGGKFFGGPKLAPTISPRKTWSGLVVGTLASAGVCAALARYLHLQESVLLSFAYGFVNAVLAQIGDLFVSYFKRKCNIKNSSGMIPGHGGFLDRFDSTIFSAPLLLFVARYFV